MKNEDLRIAEMLCTRLCHDLTGPIGAVNNGAEFLNEEGFNLQSQAVELISSSAQSAVGRLQFYRMAYGRVKENGEAPLTDSQEKAIEFFAGSNVSMVWPDEYADASELSVSLRMMRLLYNLIIIASSTLLRGGKVHVKLGKEEEGKTLEVTAKGPAVKWEQETEAYLTEQKDIEDITPKTVQFYLTRRLAEELQIDLHFSASDEEMKIQAIQKNR